MVVEHVIAILLFSGPLFYLGLWMAIDPVGIARLPEFAVRLCRRVAVRTPMEAPLVQTIERAVVSGRVKAALRITGVVLVVLAVVL